MESILLECKDVSFSHHTHLGEVNVLEHFSFFIRKGEFLSIVGPSGCGKTTILNLLTQLCTPESGTIRAHFSGENCRDFFGYMLQQDQLFEWYDIWQNVCIGPKIRHCLTEERKKYIEGLLDKYDLSAFIHKKPSQLSGGMRQRVALIRTLALKPELLYLDEPFSALDYQNRLSVAEDIRKIIRQENKTTVLVTHDIGEAISLSDRILVLSKRPAHIKKEFNLSFQKNGYTSFEIRNLPSYSTYFNAIWEELRT